MEIARTLPAQNGLAFQTSRPSLACRRVSRLKPITKASASTQTLTIESTQTHLSNLEKLLQKQTSQALQYKTETSHGDSGNESSAEQMFRDLFENLNLTRILPDMRAAEEISPRHMNHLQRLLLKSPEYSPRNNIGSRWREYHGCNDWGGLLDPLDENLRREIVKYGEFIQAAYQTFNSHPATSDDKAPLPREVSLPDKSYKVTKSLYATSSIGLPAWVDDMAPDLGWMTQRSSWIGYVAVCEDKKEISRMGRRDIVIALRGTATCLEWAENVRDILDRVPGDENSNRDQPAKVECGFLSLYKTPGSNMPSLAESVVEEVRRLKELYKGETLSITVTGHSLGAALALLAANELSTCAPAMPPIAVFSFGGPRVGNRAFANQVSENGVKVLRIVNSQDVITKVPGVFVSEEIDQKLRENEKVAGVVNVLDNMPWAYSHVGTELRVDSKMSPYLKPNADVACCHDLEAYLHLVDGFMASNCPFRANAKRSLTRLLQEQRSNVKKLYISKAKDLRLNLDNLQGVAIPSCLPSPS